MKKILALVLGLIFSLAASQAMAFSLAGGYTGPIKVKFSNYEMPSLPFALGEGQANGTEDLWGILKVTTILSDDGNDTILWSGRSDRGAHGDVLRPRPERGKDVRSIG